MIDKETAVKGLIMAKDLISDKNRWTRGVLAQNSGGDTVGPDSPDACKWCAYGAVRYASFQLGIGKSALDFYLQMGVPKNLPSGDVARLNDNYGHEAVMKMFDTAIDKTAEDG